MSQLSFRHNFLNTGPTSIVKFPPPLFPGSLPDPAPSASLWTGTFLSKFRPLDTSFVDCGLDIWFCCSLQPSLHLSLLTRPCCFSSVSSPLLSILSSLFPLCSGVCWSAHIPFQTLTASSSCDEQFSTKTLLLPLRVKECSPNGVEAVSLLPKEGLGDSSNFWHLKILSMRIVFAMLLEVEDSLFAAQG